MRIVNKSNLPEAIFRFLSNDLYDGEKNGLSYSATELLKPTKEIVLTRRHWAEIEVDAADRLWSLFGQGIHRVLEAEEGIEPIERLYKEIDGVKISGKFDRIKDNKIYDWKVTSVWTVVYKSRYEEWAQQLSIYRWLYSKPLADKGAIIAILRDWSAKDKESKGYPKGPIVEIELDLMSLEETEAFISKKLFDIGRAQGELPECSDEERWFNAKKKVYNRCERYCPAYQFCEQAKGISEKFKTN